MKLFADVVASGGETGDKDGGAKKETLISAAELKGVKPGQKSVCVSLEMGEETRQAIKKRKSAEGSSIPRFEPATAREISRGKIEVRRVPVPQNRFSPLKSAWMTLYQPLTENMKLDVRMNLKSRCVELRSRKDTEDLGALTKAAEFVRAFVVGFEVRDAIALLRLDDLYIESFEIKDVKTLNGDHLSRCIGRLAGKDGRTKFAIENMSKTRIVIADQRIHMLGSFTNVKIARDALCSLILGSPASKVYTKLRSLSK